MTVTLNNANENFKRIKIKMRLRRSYYNESLEYYCNIWDFHIIFNRNYWTNERKEKYIITILSLGFLITLEVSVINHRISLKFLFRNKTLFYMTPFSSSIKWNKYNYK